MHKDSLYSKALAKNTLIRRKTKCNVAKLCAQYPVLLCRIKFSILELRRLRHVIGAGKKNGMMARSSKVIEQRTFTLGPFP
jgi:hypothetical protein